MADKNEREQAVDPTVEGTRINRGNLTGTKTKMPDGTSLIRWDDRVPPTRIGTERTSSKGAKTIMANTSRKPGA